MDHFRLWVGRAGHLTLSGSDLSKETAQLKPVGLGSLSLAACSADRPNRTAGQTPLQMRNSHCVRLPKKKDGLGTTPR